MRARNILTILVLVLTVAVSGAAHAENRHGVQVVVLDAGHGGNDPGAVYGGVKEKDITLKVVQRLGKKIEQGMPGVKVVYTRTSDKALASTKIEDLQKRADIANKAEGDLFLSVQVNAAKSTSAKGVETLIMGETGLKIQRMNSGPKGGDQQIGAMLAVGDLDLIIFLRDPLTAQPHEPDVSALLRLGDVQKIPLATNVNSATIMLEALKNETFFEIVKPLTIRK